MIAKVSISFLSTDTDADLLVDTDKVIAAMTGNPKFPAPAPTLAEVGTAKGIFSDALSEASGGGIEETAFKDQKRVALVALMRRLATYVDGIANGDLVVLLSSGFPAQKERQPVGILPAPENLRLRRLDLSGKIKARVKPVDNAASYEWRFTTATAPTAWQSGGITTAASEVLENLTPGTVYVVQVRAIGSKGPSEWSDSASLMAV